MLSARKHIFVNARRAARAFTLLEVMIAVALLLLAMGLLLSAFVSSRRSVSLAETHLAALQLARNEAERVRTNSFSNIWNSASVVTNENIVYRLTNSVFTNRISKNIRTSIQWLPADSSRTQTFTNYFAICSTN